MRQRLPSWFKVRPPSGETYKEVKGIARGLGIATVCEEAQCPNISECWDGGTATFMVMGDVCTRGCNFCAVTTSGQGRPLDPAEPDKLVAAIAMMDLDYVVITSVDRDDLEDQGAAHLRDCIGRLREKVPDLIVEALIPDFQGMDDLIETVVAGGAQVLSHNIETVERLTPEVRDPRATYEQSLHVLEHIKRVSPETYTKSSLMLGLGETEDEVAQAMDDLLDVGVEFLTLGQYLSPSQEHLQVTEFVHPDTFERLEQLGLEKGFKYVASGPLVRSSYKAGEYYIKALIEGDEVTAE